MRHYFLGLYFSKDVPEEVSEAARILREWGLRKPKVLGIGKSRKLVGLGGGARKNSVAPPSI